MYHGQSKIKKLHDKVVIGTHFAYPSLCLADKLLHASPVELVLARALSVVPAEIVHSE